MKRLLLICVIAASALARPRALLIGINDYSAREIRTRPQPPAPGREWPDLAGAVNDVKALREILIDVYGFHPGDIVTLTDQTATRDAILHSIEQHLVAPAAKDDVELFYFAGHGSQVRNSKSDEPDALDESLIPADSRLGAPDIRDKELRRIFNRILDRGARLTILLDNCFSGSGARGFSPGFGTRGVKPDLRDLRDATDYGPRPEHRGALVISAAQDFDIAREKRDGEGRIHGAFSLAWIRALGNAAQDEPAEETFARAAARMRHDMPVQAPVLAGTAAARGTPFLKDRIDRHDGRAVVAVAVVSRDGTVQLHGGWANGLSIGTELRLAGDAASPRLAVTEIHGLTRSSARVTGERAVTPAIRSGALLEVVAWAAPPGRPMRVFVPRFDGNGAALRSLAQRLEAASAKRGLRWITDPTEATPSHMLSWSDAENAIARIPRGASVFVQFPIAATVDIGAAGIIATTCIDDADYALVGRAVAGRIAYAWVRPGATRADHLQSGLPSRTAWTTSTETLRTSMLRLRRIHAWLSLESSPSMRAPYRLALKQSDGTPVAGNTLIGQSHYTLALRATSARESGRRFVYAFVIDSAGAGTLLFPRDGSVENDVTGAEPELAKFAVGPPYGVDTYVLLITDEPLPNPWVLTWEGVRSGLLSTRSEWTIERVVFRSVPPRPH